MVRLTSKTIMIQCAPLYTVFVTTCDIQIKK